jgi:DNA-binding SARP family transcriptional activator
MRGGLGIGARLGTLNASEGTQGGPGRRWADAWEETIDDLFDQIPYGLFTVSPSGAVLAVNRTGRELLLGGNLGPSRQPLTCCDLICNLAGRGEGADENACLTQEALAGSGPMDEVRVELPPEGSTEAAWVTVSPLGADGGAIFHLRPAEEADSGRAPGASPHPHPRLRIFALGQTRVENAATGSIGGQWIERRPGQVLKYLICARQRAVDADEIAQALWPDADVRALSSVRYFVHTLRSRLEPDRVSRTPSAFIESRRGGYSLNPQRVWIDAAEFEQLVAAGLAALVAGEPEAALRRLEPATNLYRGDFLADEPYAEWALAERDRFRELAGRALRALIELRLAADDVESAARHARRLADMEPYDSDAQRRHIELSLRRGRRTEAVRRYTLFRRRLARDFGQEPDFSLTEVRRPEDDLFGD